MNDLKGDQAEKWPVLSAKELAQVLHLGRDKAYALIKSKGFPSIKIGGRYLVTGRALEEWLRKYECKSFQI